MLKIFLLIESTNLLGYFRKTLKTLEHYWSLTILNYYCMIFITRRISSTLVYDLVTMNLDLEGIKNKSAIYRILLMYHINLLIPWGLMQRKIYNFILLLALVVHCRGGNFELIVLIHFKMQTTYTNRGWPSSQTGCETNTYWTDLHAGSTFLL